ncbi:MAG: arylesterase [Deltaproteobacteria bacterium]|nr:arylesterase [Deltaproteobacteria bacterium]
MGDSLTAGYGLKEDQAYPTLLQNQFENEKIPVQILNGGVSGDTTAGGLRRLGWMIKKSSPDWVIIALGGNDMLRGLSPKKTKENLKEMIREAKKAKIKVAVLGIDAPTSLGAHYSKDFDRIFEELEREEKIPVMKNYIQSVVGKIEMNLTDRIHPNAKGQEKLAEEIFKFLYPLVKKTERSSP